MNVVRIPQVTHRGGCTFLHSLRKRIKQITFLSSRRNKNSVLFFNCNMYKLKWFKQKKSYTKRVAWHNLPSISLTQETIVTFLSLNHRQETLEKQKGEIHGFITRKSPWLHYPLVGEVSCLVLIPSLWRETSGARYGDRWGEGYDSIYFRSYFFKTTRLKPRRAMVLHSNF